MGFGEMGLLIFRIMILILKNGSWKMLLMPSE